MSETVQEQALPPAQLSPMMRQYWDVKSQHPEALLFFRVGDFYELFDGDAHVAARELDITLTSRPEPSYANGRCPMAGVPVRAAEVYLGKLVSKGYAVAICDQVGVVGAEKGPVDRQVTRILTPGTVLESHLLPARENNYLVALVRGANLWGLACVDAACGEFLVTQLQEDQLALEMGRLSPAEILVAKRTVKAANEFMPREVLDYPSSLEGCYRFTGRPAMFFQFEPALRRIQQFFEVKTLEGFGCHDMPLAVAAAGAILEYLERTQTSQMPRFDGISTYTVDGHLVIDANTRRNLELTETSRDRSFNGSLLWALDRTRTGMGSRMLRKWLLKPLYSVPAIRERQDAIQELLDNHLPGKEIGEILSHLSDLERLSVRISSASICPKDLVAVADSLSQLPRLQSALATSGSAYLSPLSLLPAEIEILRQRIASALGQEAPRELTEGGIFAAGYCDELDSYRDLLGGGKEWIETFQRKEQERTGIKSLKVNFNRTFGYYIEITHANKNAVPDDYIRKQTLTNASASSHLS